MPEDRDLDEAVGLELDELVAQGDAEMLVDHGVVYYRITEQGLRKVREAEQRGELN